MTSLIPQTIDILAALRRGERQVAVHGLKGSAPAMVAAELLRSGLDRLIVIAATQESADEFSREMLFFSGSAQQPTPFPAWDAAPFSAASPHPDISGARLDTLFRLQNGLARVTVMPVAAARQRVLPRKTLNESSCYLVAGEDFERDDLLAKLVRMGYANVPLVEDRGTFAVRGGILDIFPPNLSAPVRIEFFGDTVETMRHFDPLTQRSLQPLEELVLLPSREMLLTDEVLADIAPRLKKRCDDLEIPANRRRQILEDLDNAVYYQGVDFLQPLLHPGLETIFDYAPEVPLLLLDPEAIREAGLAFSQEVAAGSAKAVTAGMPHSPPDELFLDQAELEVLMAGRCRIELAGLTLEAAAGTAITIPCRENVDLRVHVSKESSHALAPLASTLRDWLEQRQRVIVACHQQPQAERLKDLLTPYGFRCSISEAGFGDVMGRGGDGGVTLLLGDTLARLPSAGLRPGTDRRGGAVRQARATPGRFRGAQEADSGLTGRTETGRFHGAYRPRHRPLPRPAAHQRGRCRRRLPAAGVRRQRQALPAGGPSGAGAALRRPGREFSPALDKLGGSRLGEIQGQGPQEHRGTGR